MSTRTTRTLRQLAQEAIDVQYACNPLGVSRSFAEAMQELPEVLRSLSFPADTRAIRQHPIFQLWASKIHDLAGMGLSDIDKYGVAYAEAQAIVDGLNVESIQSNSEACPGCSCEPGDGVTETCDHPDGCGYFNEIEATEAGYAKLASGWVG